MNFRFRTNIFLDTVMNIEYEIQHLENIYGSCILCMLKDFEIIINAHGGYKHCEKPISYLER